MSIRTRAVVAVLAVSLAAPLPTPAGMRDCVERRGVWLESGRCELPNEDGAARCHREGGRWLSSKGQCEIPPIDADEECKKRGGVGVQEGKCYRIRTRDDRD